MNDGGRDNSAWLTAQFTHVNVSRIQFCLFLLMNTFTYYCIITISSDDETGVEFEFVVNRICIRFDGWLLQFKAATSYQK